MYEKIVLRRKGGLRGISNQNKRKQTKNKEETKAKRSDLK